MSTPPSQAAAPRLPLFVELLDRDGAVVARQRCDRLPITVGRGYDNDLIVDDPYLAPRHLVIDCDAEGRLLARDAGSRNGIRLDGAKPRRRAADGEIELVPNRVLCAGHSRLRVRAADHPVADELPDPVRDQIEGLRAALPALLLAALFGLLQGWLADLGDGGRVAYVGTAAATLTLVLLWAAGWGLINRLFGGRVRFGRHLAIGTLTVLAYAAVETLAEHLSYALALNWLDTYAGYLALLVPAAAVYAGITTIRLNAQRFALWMAGGFALTACGLLALNQYQTDRTLGVHRYAATLSWPAWRLTRPMDGAAFVATADRLAERADAARRASAEDTGDDEAGSDD